MANRDERFLFFVGHNPIEPKIICLCQRVVGKSKADNSEK